MSAPLQVMRLCKESHPITGSSVEIQQRVIPQGDVSEREGWCYLQRGAGIDRFLRVAVITEWRKDRFSVHWTSLFWKNTTPPPTIETVNLRNALARQCSVLKVYFLFYLFSLSAAEVQEINFANHEYFHGYLVLLILIFCNYSDIPPDLDVIVLSFKDWDSNQMIC